MNIEAAYIVKGTKCYGLIMFRLGRRGDFIVWQAAYSKWDATSDKLSSLLQWGDTLVLSNAVYDWATFGTFDLIFNEEEFKAAKTFREVYEGLNED